MGVQADKRTEIQLWTVDKKQQGKPLTDAETSKSLALSCSYLLLTITEKIVAGHYPDKTEISCLNKLMNTRERWDASHKDPSKGDRLPPKTYGSIFEDSDGQTVEAVYEDTEVPEA